MAADLRLLNDVHRPAADYAAQGEVLPGLLLELQALVSDPRKPRRPHSSQYRGHHRGRSATAVGGRGDPIDAIPDVPQVEPDILAVPRVRPYVQNQLPTRVITLVGLAQAPSMPHPVWLDD